jgi:hypothetical protein
VPDTIRDGSGTGNLAKINANKRLYVQAVTESEEFASNVSGDAYNINTGVITLTDSVDTPCLYLKNNETQDLVISAVAIGLGPSTGGSGGWAKATFIRNPTTGTIISSPTNVDINSNRNYGSSNTLTADAYKGATGDTMTDGTDHSIVNIGTSGPSFITINEIVPQGKSFGVKIDPQPSNTSQDVYVAVICYLKDANA